MNDRERLGQLIRQRRLERRLTQASLASICDPQLSESAVNKVEKGNYSSLLPKRPREGGSILEVIAGALEVDVVEFLSCLPEHEVLDSSLASYLAPRIGSTITLQGFVSSLPSTPEGLLSLEGALQLKNEKAFAYIFALERIYDGLEMLIVNELPLIMFDEEDQHRWSLGMLLSPADDLAFRALFADYKSHFRSLLAKSKKRYQIVLNLRSYEKYLSRKSQQALFAHIDDMLSFTQYSSDWELLFHEGADQLEEYEVICKTKSIPQTYDGTLSVVIRQSSLMEVPVEYALVPMPDGFRSLERDIQVIRDLRAKCLDQYAATLQNASSDMDPSIDNEFMRVTAWHLRRLRNKYS